MNFFFALLWNKHKCFKLCLNFIKFLKKRNNLLSRYFHYVNLIKSFINREAILFPEAEKMAYLGFKDGFQEAQKVTTSFIYNQYHPSISSPLVASINAKLASIFDQSFKSMNWLRSVYGNDFKGQSISFLFLQNY